VPTKPTRKARKAAPRPRGRAKPKKAKAAAPKKRPIDLEFVRALLQAYLKHFRKELAAHDDGVERLIAALRRTQSKRRVPKAG
jgi:hypothetical protein